jgi:hypothetical protein
MLRAPGVTRFPIFLRPNVDQSGRATANLVHGIVRRNFPNLFLRLRDQPLETIRFFRALFVRQSWLTVEL